MTSCFAVGILRMVSSPKLRWEGPSPAEDGRAQYSSKSPGSVRPRDRRCFDVVAGDGGDKAEIAGVEAHREGVSGRNEVGQQPLPTLENYHLETLVSVQLAYSAGLNGDEAADDVLADGEAGGADLVTLGLLGGLHLL